MYSDVVNGLGLSQNTLELIVLIAIGIFILGVILVLYWKHIIVGGLALSCLIVLANHKSPEPVVTPVVEKKSEPVVEKKEEVINHVKPEVEQKQEAPVQEPPVKNAYKSFMDDCIEMADYSKSYCEDLWQEKIQEEREILEETRLKGKRHEKYQKVRNKA